MQKDYLPEKIEQQAQKDWDDLGLYHVNTDHIENPYYCLCMFPYTSGELHMGHVRNYAIGDAISRYKMMQGYDVLQPMGWDSFGLPAENAAIKSKSHPAKWTYKNMDVMRSQFKQLGLAYDWRREFATCQPDYYRWQQWLFIQMVKKGLAYRKSSVVNWDPIDQTVLANEQVINGCGWRSGAPVERKKIAQWFLKITDYSEKLLDGLDTLDQWPSQVKIMQKNWIGKSTGSTIYFHTTDTNTLIETFTTRIDTLYGATFLALSPDHPLLSTLKESNPALAAFIISCQTTTTQEADIATMEKRGFDTGLFVTHPLTKKKLPVWVANYILMDYGTGAVMCVPAHDERDLAFAKQYSLPVIQSIDESGEHPRLINSDEMNGLTPEEARVAITKKLEKDGLAKFVTTYRLRDWGVSRQRYWGVPIPIIYCDHCGVVTEREENLPVKLPESIDYEYGKAMLKECDDFYHVRCPECGSAATRETDTFDTFFDSSWYYHYFIAQDDDKMIAKNNDAWLPVNNYVGGIEHAILHLLYARFVQMVLKDIGVSSHSEPFKSLLSQGMVLKDGAKMSKSKGNVVQPLALIKKYGADTVRLFILFASPPEQTLEWSDGGIDGAHRFIRKLWNYAYENQSAFKHAAEFSLEGLNESAKKALISTHQELEIIHRDIEKNHFNTVVSGAMKIFKYLTSLDYVPGTEAVQCHIYRILIRILAPITPHVCYALWQECGFGDNICHAPWPASDPNIINIQSTIQYVVQINGKTKGTISAGLHEDKDAIIAQISNHSNLSKFMQKDIKKVILVPKKLINIVF